MNVAKRLGRVENIVGKRRKCWSPPFSRFPHNVFKTLPLQGRAPPGWLSGERVELMTWWLCVRSPIEANFLGTSIIDT